MAPVVKRLRPRIVVPICMGSNPIRRPIFRKSLIYRLFNIIGESMKNLFLAILILAMFPNVSFAIGSKSTMKKVMDSWIGENLETVIDHWGYPTQEKTIAGKKLYYWINSSYEVLGNQYGVYGGDSTCNRILEVDKNNRVIKWQWEGNNCPATYFTGKKFVNPNNNPWRKKNIK